MKRIAVILLAFICLLQAGGMLFLYQVQQFRIQFEKKGELSDSRYEFQELILSVSDFDKAKIDESEISYLGKMYDYKSASVSGNTVTLLVINDTEEESILQTIHDFIEISGKQGKKIPLQLEELLSVIYLCPDFQFNFNIPFFQERILRAFAERILTVPAEILAPPPRKG